MKLYLEKLIFFNFEWKLEKKKVKYVVKIQHFVHLIKIIGFFKKNRPYLYIKTVFIINNKQKQTKEKYD